MPISVLRTRYLLAFVCCKGAKKTGIRSNIGHVCLVIKTNTCWLCMVVDEKGRFLGFLKNVFYVRKKKFLLKTSPFVTRTFALFYILECFHFVKCKLYTV